MSAVFKLVTRMRLGGTLSLPVLAQINHLATLTNHSKTHSGVLGFWGEQKQKKKHQKGYRI